MQSKHEESLTNTALVEERQVIEDGLRNASDEVVHAAESAPEPQSPMSVELPPKQELGQWDFAPHFTALAYYRINGNKFEVAMFIYEETKLINPELDPKVTKNWVRELTLRCPGGKAAVVYADAERKTPLRWQSHMETLESEAKTELGITSIRNPVEVHSQVVKSDKARHGGDPNAIHLKIGYMAKWDPNQPLRSCFVHEAGENARRGYKETLYKPGFVDIRWALNDQHRNAKVPRFHKHLLVKAFQRIGDPRIKREYQDLVMSLDSILDVRQR
jgi:hypothetical protein